MTTSSTTQHVEPSKKFDFDWQAIFIEEKGILNLLYGEDWEHLTTNAYSSIVKARKNTKAKED